MNEKSKLDITNCLVFVAGWFFLIMGIRGLIYEEVQVRVGHTFTLSNEPYFYWIFVVLHFAVGIFSFGYIAFKKDKANIRNECE